MIGTIGFGRAVGQRAQPRPLTADQNDRLHGGLFRLSRDPEPVGQLSRATLRRLLLSP